MNAPNPVRRAFVVSDYLHEHSVIVFATKRSEAIASAVGELNEEYIRARCRRAPEFDAGIPSWGVLCREHGWHFECRVCGSTVHDYSLEDGAVFDKGDDEMPLCAKCVPRTAACCDSSKCGATP